jgi:hypothetical protein
MWRETQSHVIHAECKSFNSFEPKDIRRMKSLADVFPGSALIFATLNDKLQESEVRLIRAMATTERRKKLRGKPNSPVILLTGTELFSTFGITDCWKGKGGLYDQLSERSFELFELSALADATQQLYLNLPSWYKWYETEWGKRRLKTKKQNNSAKK